MGTNTAVMFINLGIVAAVIAATYLTGSAWCLWGLLFLCGTSHTQHNHTCPHCGKEWKS